MDRFEEEFTAWTEKLGSAFEDLEACAAAAAENPNDPGVLERYHESISRHGHVAFGAPKSV